MLSDFKPNDKPPPPVGASNRIWQAWLPWIRRISLSMVATALGLTVSVSLTEPGRR